MAEINRPPGRKVKDNQRKCTVISCSKSYFTAEVTCKIK